MQGKLWFLASHIYANHNSCSTILLLALYPLFIFFTPNSKHLSSLLICRKCLSYWHQFLYSVHCVGLSPSVVLVDKIALALV